MAKKKNSTAVLDDVTTYASRYGYDALGYALLEMMRSDSVKITQEQAAELWEYGGSKPDPEQ